MNRSFGQQILGLTIAGVLTTVAAAADLTGTWQMTVVHGQDHGVPMGLELRQDGDKLTGVIHSPHGDKIAVAGTFVDNKLALTSETSGALTVTGELEEDGTLSGELMGTMGRMSWTAERLGRGLVAQHRERSDAAR